MVILAIETALKRGTLAILNDDTEIASATLNDDEKVSENLLTRLDGLLREAKVNQSEIDSLAISNGPGSLTGVKVGIATGLGFADAIGIKAVGVPLLSAFRYSVAEDLVVVVGAVGRNQCTWQLFDKEQGSEVNLIKIEEIGRIREIHPTATFALDPDLAHGVSEMVGKIVTVTQNPAVLIGRFAKKIIENGGAATPSPILIGQTSYKKIDPNS